MYTHSMWRFPAQTVRKLLQVRMQKKTKKQSTQALDWDYRGYFWTSCYDSSVAVWRPDVSRCVIPLIVTLIYPKPSPAPELSSDMRSFWHKNKHGAQVLVTSGKENLFWLSGDLVQRWTSSSEHGNQFLPKCNQMKSILEQQYSFHY